MAEEESWTAFAAFSVRNDISAEGVAELNAFISSRASSYPWQREPLQFTLINPSSPPRSATPTPSTHYSARPYAYARLEWGVNIEVGGSDFSAQPRLTDALPHPLLSSHVCRTSGLRRGW
jgi:hypothetical protein